VTASPQGFQRIQLATKHLHSERSSVPPLQRQTFAKLCLPVGALGQNIGVMSLPQPSLSSVRRTFSQQRQIYLMVLILHLALGPRVASAGDSLPEVSVSSVQRVFHNGEHI
jgi:hypothetical protein